MNNSLNKFFKNVEFSHPLYKKLWANVYDSFSFSIANKGSVEHFTTSNDKLPSVYFPSGVKENYLPVEFLKGSQKNYVSKELIERPEKFFLSSGTTSANRSRSYFSKDGLTLYKLSSLKVFYDLLSFFFEKKDIMSLRGISLIPNKDIWPQSSLAQMIHWFSEFWDVSYFDTNKLMRERITQPVWIFATALQLKDLKDKQCKIPLPPGSVVIETGGLKGSKESLTRAELYQGIKDVFLVPQTRIISEYGMCELSCQAYDFSLELSDLKERSYRFPFWVDVLVLRPLDKVVKESKGCLLIKDPLRIDYPYALRTQDIVSIDAHSGFVLHGRVPSATLKGCSLLSEELINSSSRGSSDHSVIKKVSQRKKLAKISSDLFSPVSDKTIKEVYLFLTSFFAREDIYSSLLEEMSSKKLVDLSISDLLDNFPHSTEMWQEIILNAKSVKGESWLLIIPNNHPFVIFYPCVVAFFSQLSLTVRFSRVYAESSVVGKFLREFSSFFNYYISLLGAECRIPNEIVTSDYHGLIAYGSDEVISDLRLKASCPANLFGSGISISVIDHFDDDAIKYLLKDAFSLGQKGCFSARIIFFPKVTDRFEKVIKSLTIYMKKFLRSYYNFQLPISLSLALDHERVDFLVKDELSCYFTEDRLPLFLFYDRTSSNHIEVHDYLSSCQFVLPIVFCSEDSLLRLLLQPSLIKKISVSKSYYKSFINKFQSFDYEICTLGNLNKTEWNGTHQAKAIFSKV